MNVYDFDGTIYRGDSSVDFFLYCLKKKPALLRFLPKQALGFIRYARKKIDKTRLKECYFCFLRGLSAPEETVDQFWEFHQGKIYAWYLKQSDKSDVVISASPYFLIKPICDRLHISDPIASDVDISTGGFCGANCWGQEKVTQFSAQYGAEKIDAFYSDSLSDQPMAAIAQQPFIIKKGNIYPWKNNTV